MTARGVEAALKSEGVKPGAGVQAMLTEAEQAELFAEDMREQAGELEGAAAIWDGRGRKPGARNRTTQRVVDFILNNGRDPLIFWSTVLSVPVEEVQRRYGFKAKADAAEFQRRCAADLAPYVHSRRPLAVDVQQRRYEEIRISFADPARLAPADIDGGAGAILADYRAIEEIKENQGLSEDDAEEVGRALGRMAD